MRILLALKIATPSMAASMAVQYAAELVDAPAPVASAAAIAVFWLTAYVVASFITTNAILRANRH